MTMYNALTQPPVQYWLTQIFFSLSHAHPSYLLPLLLLCPPDEYNLNPALEWDDEFTGRSTVLAVSIGLRRHCVTDFFTFISCVVSFTSFFFNLSWFIIVCPIAFFYFISDFIIIVNFVLVTAIRMSKNHCLFEFVA